SRISQRVDKNSQRVDLLVGDRMTLQETVWTVEEEAYAARVAWNHSIGLSQETYQELQTHRDHVYAHETHFQTHQTQLQLQSPANRGPSPCQRYEAGDRRHADRVAIPARAVEERETARTGCYAPKSPGGYDTDRDLDRDPDRDTDRDPDRDTDRDPDCDTDRDPDRDPDHDTDRDPDCDRSPSR
ncbi:hypothetical protein Tco_1269863, partial [Tanacetum coccineum]